MKCIKRIVYWATPAMLLTALPAYAHPLPGDALGGFAAGMLHPLLGIDHLLAMVAVGVWAAQLGGSALWKVPLAFVCTLLIGAGVGLSGISLPMIEPMVAASVMALGLAISMRASMPPWLASMLVAAFALFHGHAHMSELSVGASVLTYVVGFTLTTALLHAAGIAAGYLLQRHAHVALVRAGGIGLAGVGVWLLAGI
jgi:urease accessory protein